MNKQPIEFRKPLIPRLWDEIYAIITAKDKRYSAKRLGTLLVLLVVLFVTAGYYSALTVEIWSLGRNVRGLPLQLSWAIIAGGMVIFLAMLGLQVHDRVGGALIDQRNAMSLARFQLVSWTVLVSSAFLAIALIRIFAQVDDPLAIDIPAQVWQLLGISAGSTIGRGMILSNKRMKAVPNAEVVAKDTTEALNATISDETPEQKTTPDEIEEYRQGSVYCNPTATDASIVDMFQGDEVGNTAQIDMSKVQMFFFTIAALIAYGSSIYGILGNSPDNLASLPEVTPGLIAILGISHVAYLGTKALDHTTTAVSPVAQAAATDAVEQDG
jgi:hypothetical protein